MVNFSTNASSVHAHQNDDLALELQNERLPHLPTEQSTGRCTHTSAFCQGAGQLGQPRKVKRKEKDFKNTDVFHTVI